MTLRTPGPVRDDRGSAIVLAAICMTALLAAVALAIDMGMLFTARGEAQRVADLSAMAGASAFIEEPLDPEPRARDLAMDFALRNNVREQFIALQDGDVQVDVATRRVTVTVHRDQERGNAVATWFARIFGVDEVDIGARATAEAVPAGGGTCLMPFAVADLWDDLPPGNDRYDTGEYYERGTTGYGSSWRNGVPSNNGIDPAGTTYVNDIGRPLALKEGSTNQGISASWYFPWNVPQVDGSPDVGGDDYRWNIENCNPAIALIGQEYMVETGFKQGPTHQGVSSRMAKDNDAYFDLATGTIKGSVMGDEAWKASPRIINLPLFDPRETIPPGKVPVVFNNFAAFYLEGIRGNKEIIGRFLYATGVGVPGGGEELEDVAGSALTVRLIE